MKSNEFLQTNDETSLNHGGYGASLFDPRWKAKRLEILNRDNNKCLVCGSSNDLQIHHRQYHFSITLNSFRNPWEYDNRFLITLCETCHQKGHRLYKVPTKHVK